MLEGYLVKVLCEAALRSSGGKLICAASMGSCQHKNDFLFFIDFIKKTPRADAIPPGIRGEVFKFLDIWTEMRVLAQLRVNDVSQF